MRVEFTWRDQSIVETTSGSLPTMYIAKETFASAGAVKMGFNAPVAAGALVLIGFFVAALAIGMFEKHSPMMVAAAMVETEFRIFIVHLKVIFLLESCSSFATLRFYHVAKNANVKNPKLSFELAVARELH
jgi:hypothetical protein